MINYSPFYGNTSEYKASGDTNKSADYLDITLANFFNPGGALYSSDYSKLIDDSVYLLHIKPESSAATNATFCIDISSDYSMECAYNAPAVVPMSMALCDVDSSGEAGEFYSVPTQRVAFDYPYLYARNYTNVYITPNIVYKNFCANAVITVFDEETKGTNTKSLSNIAAYIDEKPLKRYVCQIDYRVYAGESVRNDTKTYIAPTNKRVVPVIDILTERPIPANATGIKSAMHYESDGTTYISEVDETKVYLPYKHNTQRYHGESSVGGHNYYTFGFYRNTLKISDITTGFKAVSPHTSDRSTSAFLHIAEHEQIYDDVCFSWSLRALHYSSNTYLEENDDLTQYTSTDRVDVLGCLSITDDKGESAGKAVELAIKHELACLGLYFADSETNAKNAVLGVSDASIFLPEIVEGVTTGYYFTGDDIPDVPYSNAEDVSDFEFSPAPSGDDDEGLTDSIINTGTIGGGCMYYAMTSTEMQALSTWLNTTYTPTDYDEFIVDFKGTNPADYISTVVYYPFDIPLSGTTEYVYIGKLNTGAQGQKLPYTYGQLYDFGSHTFPAFNDFRDYLTKLSVIIPFCGTVDLDPILWAGRTLTVKMAIDWPTGACTAWLYRTGENGKTGIIDSISGQIGVPLPLSSLANGSYQVSLTNMLAQHSAANRQQILSALGVAGSAIGAIGGAMTGNLAIAGAGVLGMASSGIGMENAAAKMDNLDYNIEHTQPTVQNVSGGSPFLNCGTDYRVVIMRAAPKLLPGYNEGAYAKTTGYATCKQGALSDISSGFTQCASADLSDIAATSAELRMIFELLQGGVIV